MSTLLPPSWLCRRSQFHGSSRIRQSHGLTFPLLTPAILSLVSLVDSHRFEGPSSAPVSTVVGFAFPFHNRFSGACLTPQLCPEGSSQPFFAPFSRVAELGEAPFCLNAIGI
jgi:hypothetical protein